MGTASGHTVLLVPVPELEPFIRARWQHYDATWVSLDPDFTHAHVTVLSPFVVSPTGSDLARVAEVAAAVEAFDFVLADVGTFASGLIHLAPEPATPFAELTDRVGAAFPALSPYDGAFEAVPHLTLDQAGAGVTEASVRAALGPSVPVTCRADRLELHWYAEGDCRVLETWKLGRG